MRKSRIAVALASGALLCASLSFADDPKLKKTLKRPEDPVVLTGSLLPRVKGVHKDNVRLYAFREEKLTPVPFQVDEKTPELNYCWTTGPDPVKDLDEGKIDDDDEVVFMARDAGDKAPGDVSLEGSSQHHEIELEDPRTGERGWVYLFSFPDAKTAPAPSETRYAKLTIDRKEIRFETPVFEVASVPSAGATGRPVHVRLRDASGKLGREVVRDGARGALHASYLFVHVDRDSSEARTSLGTSYIDGPVRVVAPVAIEAYLVWGNWISAVRSELFVYRSRWEQRTRLSVPVNLDASERSDVTIGFELAPGLEGFSFKNDRNATAVPLSGEGQERLFRELPRWNVAAGPEGAVITGLRLDPRLAGARSGLHFQPSSLDSGGQVGFRLDLTGLKKSDDASPYAVDYWIGLAPDYRPGDEARFVESEESPLVTRVR